MTFRKVGERLLATHWNLSLSVAEYEASDGERFERGLIKLPHAVGVVPIDGDELVLVSQYRSPLERTILEIPAGLCDVEGEPEADTAQRELIEEAGLRAGSLEPLTRIQVAAGIMNHWVDIFLGLDLTEVPTERHGPEEAAMTIVRVPLASVPEMIAAGELFDAKTVVGCLLAHARLCT